MIVGYTIWNKKGPLAKTQHAHRQPLQIRSDVTVRCREPKLFRSGTVPFAKTQRPQKQPLRIWNDVSARSRNNQTECCLSLKNSARCSIGISSSVRSVRNDEGYR